MSGDGRLRLPGRRSAEVPRHHRGEADPVRRDFVIDLPAIEATPIEELDADTLERLRSALLDDA